MMKVKIVKTRIKNIKNRYNGLKEIYKLLICIAFGIAVGLVISNCSLTRAKVIGSSMEPTYYSDDNIFVCRVMNPNRGDVVVVKNKDKNLIKRVVGLPGDTVQIVDSMVFLNGELYEEDYISSELVYDGGLAEEEIHLGEDEYFVLGDNRPVSMDSRIIGPIKEKDILGVVLD